MLQYIILCGLQAQGRAKGDITKSPRSMAKLLKEAKRVKMVLSANTDHVAQVRPSSLCNPFKDSPKMCQTYLLKDSSFDIFERLKRQLANLSGRQTF